MKTVAEMVLVDGKELITNMPLTAERLIKILSLVPPETKIVIGDHHLCAWRYATVVVPLELQFCSDEPRIFLRARLGAVDIEALEIMG